jgi:hypothetical protein
MTPAAHPQEPPERHAPGGIRRLAVRRAAALPTGTPQAPAPTPNTHNARPHTHKHAQPDKSTQLPRTVHTICFVLDLHSTACASHGEQCPRCSKDMTSATARVVSAGRPSAGPAPSARSATARITCSAKYSLKNAGLGSSKQLEITGEGGSKQE